MFFLWEITESLKGWRRKPGKSPGIHDIFLPIMANRCLSWLPRLGWFAILRNPLWKGIWTYSEDLPIDFISKASKQLANPPISPPFHVAADLSLAPRWGKGFRHTFGWNTSFPTFLAPGLSSVSFNRNQGEKPKGRLKGKAKVQAMMLIIANTLVFESPFFLGTLYLNHHHMLANVSLFFVEGENSWYIHSVSSPTSIWGNLQRDTFI